MARYTYSFLVKLPLEDIHAYINQVMPVCHFDMIYGTNEYLMARETPGNVPFTKLVTTEILIDSTMASNKGVRVNFVVKNDELPLQVNNHCHQLSQKVKDAISENKAWHLITVTTD